MYRKIIAAVRLGGSRSPNYIHVYILVNAEQKSMGMIATYVLSPSFMKTQPYLVIYMYNNIIPWIL